MPQLDFLIYFYQYLLLSVSFFLLYDLFLNYWLPIFLINLYMENRKYQKVCLLMSSLILSPLNSYFYKIITIKNWILSQ